MQESITLDNLLRVLPSVKEQHARSSPLYPILDQAAQSAVEKLFCEESAQKRSFGPFGALVFPYFTMGAINSLHLFGLDELIIFSFYWANRSNYKKVLDIGANIGLHSILMARCGFEVQLFEPDPIHFQQLKSNLALNDAKGVKPHCAAVSNKSGTAEFVRVLGNTTSSHLAGSKQPYGELERFSVPLVNIKDLIRGVDLIKMDVEGHENEIILATTAEDWRKTDAFMEVGSLDKAEQVFEHFKREKVNLFAQKIGWRKVDRLEDMPASYKDGSLFISSKTMMPWSPEHSMSEHESDCCLSI